MIIVIVITILAYNGNTYILVHLGRVHAHHLRADHRGALRRHDLALLVLSLLLLVVVVVAVVVVEVVVVVVVVVVVDLAGVAEPLRVLHVVLAALGHVLGEGLHILCLNVNDCLFVEFMLFVRVYIVMCYFIR